MVFKGRSIFIRHLKDKVGRKKHLNDLAFLRTYRMSRKSSQQIVNEIKDNEHFINKKKSSKESEEKEQEHLLHFLNFVGTFGDGVSNNKSKTHYEKGTGT